MVPSQKRNAGPCMTCMTVCRSQTLYLKASFCLLDLIFVIFIFFSGGGSECACGDVREVVVVVGE